MLDAENPLTFVDRVADAYHRRALVEKLLQQQFYIDSMPRQHAQQLPDNIRDVVNKQVIYLATFISGLYNNLLLVCDCIWQVT